MHTPYNYGGSAFVAAVAGILITVAALTAQVGAASDPGGRLRLVFDDYYQRDRTGKPFSQGVALRAADRPFANYYAPDSNANSNGTFALAHLVADRFKVEMSSRPISEELLKECDAYMLLCPIKLESGGRAALGEKEASLLEAFVARGGMLALVFNSVTDPARTDFDYAGVNRIARKFGLEFLIAETGTLSVPVPPDHPIFDGVDSIIYGSGTTMRVLPGTEPKPIVLMSDPRDGGGNAPFGLLASYKKGRVLTFGDGGTFGSAHAFRGDLQQAKGMQQMLYALLPDGPVPAYGWKKGLRMKIRLKHEQMVAGYEFENRLLALRHPKNSERLEAAARSMEIAMQGDKQKAAEQMGYTSIVGRNEGTLHLEIGALEGAAFKATVRAGSEDSVTCRVTPRGRVLDLGMSRGEALDAWQWALVNQVICAVSSFARPGDTWEGDSLTPVPHAQLAAVPTLAAAEAKFRFEGEESYAGKSCYLISRTVFSRGADWRFQDFVLPESLPLFGPDQITLLSRGQMEVTRYWIDRQTRLPVHTEMRISSSIWWKDNLYPERYEGTHDWRNFENFKQVNFIADFGRLMTADFETE